MILMVSPAYFPEAAGRAHGDEEAGSRANAVEEPSPTLTTPASTPARESQPLIIPSSTHRRGVDEEIGIGISPLPPTYSRTAPARHSVVATSPLSPVTRDNTLRIDTTDLEPPNPPEDEPLPRYSRYPKSEVDASAGPYRGDDSIRSMRGIRNKKICGIYMRTVVTGVVILITACVIAGGIVGYQIRNDSWPNFGDDTSDSVSPSSPTSSSDTEEFRIQLDLSDTDNLPTNNDNDSNPILTADYSDEPIPEPAPERNDIEIYGYPDPPSPTDITNGTLESPPRRKSRSLRSRR